MMKAGISNDASRPLPGLPHDLFAEYAIRQHVLMLVGTHRVLTGNPG